MAFHVPTDSLARRYHGVYRLFTWEGARGPSGVKILPEIREQLGGTCIYEAMAAWIDMLARMEGRICKISAMDLQMKEECLMSEETDRTKRCIDVLENIGLCSEADFESNNPNPTLYGLHGTKLFVPLSEEHLKEAVNTMETVPLLAVFHVDSNYIDYILRFYQRPVLSYKRYEEGRMSGHAACVIGYGVEAVVPFWKFLSSQKNITRPSKGLGRVLPQNVYYLYAPLGLRIWGPEANLPPPAAPQAAAEPQPPAAPDSKRKRFDDGHEVASDAQSIKRRKLDH